MYSSILWFSYQHTTKTGSLQHVHIFTNMYKCPFIFFCCSYSAIKLLFVCVKIETSKYASIAPSSYHVGYPTFVSYDFCETFGIGQYVGEINVCKCVLLSKQVNLVAWLHVSYVNDRAEKICILFLYGHGILSVALKHKQKA